MNKLLPAIILIPCITFWIYILSQQLKIQLTAMAPSLFTTDTSQAKTLILPTNATIQQTITIPQTTTLSQLLVPYQNHQLNPKGSLIITVQTASQTPQKFIINDTQLTTTNLLELSLNLSVKKSTQLTISLQIQSPNPNDSITFFSQPNPWLLPHRYPGSLIANPTQTDHQLTLQPIFTSHPLTASKNYQHVPELIYFMKTNTLQTLLIAAIIICFLFIINTTLPIQTYPPKAYITIYLSLIIWVSIYYAFSRGALINIF